MNGLLAVIVALLVSGVIAYPLAKRQRDEIARGLPAAPRPVLAVVGRMPHWVPDLAARRHGGRQPRGGVAGRADLRCTGKDRRPASGSWAVARGWSGGRPRY